MAVKRVAKIKVMSFKNLIGIKIFGLFLIALGATMTSCNNDEDPTVAELIFIDLDSNMVPNVEIVLDCTTSLQLPCNVHIEGQSDESGRYSRVFDEPKILNVNGKAYTEILDGAETLANGNIIPVRKLDSLFVQGTINIKKYQTNKKVFQMDTIPQ